MAVVRLKRRLNEEPVEALLLSCKKKREEDNTESKDNVTAVVKFAGTVQNQEESISHISKAVKKDKTLLLKHQTDVIGKLRTETKNISQQNRFKVVNCFRALENVSENENSSNEDKSESSNKQFTVLDIVSSTERDSDMPEIDNAIEAEEENEDYVYDLYYGQGDVDDLMMETVLSVQPVHLHALYYRTGESDHSDFEDSEDSNAENNWKNDYPDSDNSINEDDMRLAVEMEECHIGNELSSDEGEEELVYGHDVDPKDVYMYGAGYAKYKAKVSRDLDSEYYAHEDSDDDSYYRAYDDEDDDPEIRFQ